MVKYKVIYEGKVSEYFPELMIEKHKNLTTTGLDLYTLPSSAPKQLR